MYDRNWARRVVIVFRNTYTRVSNLDACIRERYALAYPSLPVPTVADLIQLYTTALQDKRLARTWFTYRKFVKRTPLDRDLLDLVVADIATLRGYAPGEDLQQCLFNYLTPV